MTPEERRTVREALGLLLGYLGGILCAVAMGLTAIGLVLFLAQFVWVAVR